MRWCWLPLLLLGCSDDRDSAEPTHPTALPGHNDCLPEGEAMDDATCAAVVEADDRLPTVPQRADHTTEDPDDPRLVDPEYEWMTAEVKRCTCVCCHSQHIGGPGSHRWDIEFEPVWIDSMNNWSISVFGGYTDEVDQTLPTDDLDRLRAVLQAELDRRAAN